MLVGAVAFAVALARSASAADAPPTVPDDDTSLAPPPVRHPYTLTLLEELGALALQGAWYWSHSGYGSAGTDVTPGHFFSSLVSDDFVLDDDHFRTNGSGHPMAGAVAYQIARGNGFSVGASFVVSFLSAVAWKYFGEWDQTHSTNDIIMTPAAGWVIGEATYRVGRWFAAREPGVFNCLGAAALSPIAVFNGSTVCGFGRGDGPPSGVHAPTWIRLAGELGPSITTFDGRDQRAGAAIGVEALTRANARYGSPGAGSSTAWPGQWSSVRGRLLVEEGTIRGTTFDADALVIGRYVRRYAETDGPARETNGWSALLGLSSSFDYESRLLPIGWDRSASAGILGPTIELSARRGPLQLRGTIAARYAFSQVTSLAYAAAAPTFAGVQLKRVLQQEGYYYAQGPVTSAVIEGEVGGVVRVAVEGRVANFWSIDSDYSNQNEIENNFSLRDTRVFTRASASLRPMRGPVRVALELDDNFRDSHIPGTTVRSNERRFLASLAIVNR